MTLEGKKAPEFTLLGSDGREHSLKEYAGRTIVIYFYPKDNTPCQWEHKSVPVTGIEKCTTPWERIFNPGKLKL